jgi:mercuric ion binding protein
MKNLLVFIVGSLISSSSFAYAKDLKVTVNGMVCSFCAQGIEKKLSSQAAVKSVDVNLENHLVKVALKDGQDLSDTTIAQILKDAGYSVSKIQRD